jgi:CheY-like chemotaxis protein
MATILVVDDQPENRQLLTTLLGYRGHRLREATNGAEALETVRAERPDLIITDLLMPTMDGYEFVRQVRADPVLAQTRVIFYTAAYHEREAAALARKCGVTHLLTKPMEPAAVFRMVEDALGCAAPPFPPPALHEIDREHLRLLTDTLSEKVKELELSNRAKDQFLATLSHELRTPLTPVALAVSELRYNPTTPADLQPILDMIRRNVDLETRLIDDLLDISLITCGKLRLDLQMVDVHVAIRQTLEICRSEFDAGAFRLVLDLAAAAHHVRGDPARLQQVFRNVVKNALKFTPARGTITIRSSNQSARTSGSAGPDLVVAISDDGIGIGPETLPVIFRAFEQGEAGLKGRRGGLGLGLTISRSVIEEHGGRLSAVSAGTGHGATFILELATVPAPVDAAAESPPAKGDLPALRPLRILLVEDHSDTLRFLALLLGQRRHLVRTATTLKSARELAASEGFDLLISDIELPDGTGLELMHGIGAERSIPGIAMSGHGSKEDLRKSEAAGFAEHLIKPIDIRILEGAIQRATMA